VGYRFLFRAVRVLANERPAGDGSESYFDCYIPQLEERILVLSVSVNHHHDGRYAVSLEPPKPDDGIDGDSPAIYRSPNDG
jgi:hypothetical protein